MNALYLLRHSLTEANERRLYCGWTDLPLSAAGVGLALEARDARPLPRFDRCATSGLVRADETLRLLAGRDPDAVLPDLREMHFGSFEMLGYDDLKRDPDYLRWIDDGTGDVTCPGGESRSQFAERVLRGGRALLSLPGERALAVLHGGAIVALMCAWFPAEARGFYDWQPAPCRGYRVCIEGGIPASFEAI